MSLKEETLFMIYPRCVSLAFFVREKAADYHLLAGRSEERKNESVRQVFASHREAVEGRVTLSRPVPHTHTAIKVERWNSQG